MWLWIAGSVLAVAGAAAGVFFMFFNDPPDKVKIKGRICMPLFYPIDSGGFGHTWNYLSMSENERAACRWWIKHFTAKGETPAITFLLSPPQEAGNIFVPWPVVNKPNLDRAVKIIKEELVAEGIAPFACPYTDDKPPWWYDIGKVSGSWAEVHSAIGKHINGYILSIEADEQTRLVESLDDCIYEMRQIMPGVDYYGVHLHWHSKSKVSSYIWKGGTSTPVEANLILAETSGHPKDGDKVSIDKLRAEARAILAGNPNVKICLHEYNKKANGATANAQRDMLRQLGFWGVG